MPTKIIREPAHVDALGILLGARKFPMTVTWTQGASKTDNQNRLAQRWFTDISRQLGDQTHEDVRAECKVLFGVPILRAENEAFRVEWDAAFAPLSHEQAVHIVKMLDIPVTRKMLVKQMTAFMDAVHRQFTSQGVHLTDPEALKYEQEFV